MGLRSYLWHASPVQTFLETGAIDLARTSSSRYRGSQKAGRADDKATRFPQALAVMIALGGLAYALLVPPERSPTPLAGTPSHPETTAATTSHWGLAAPSTATTPLVARSKPIALPKPPRASAPAPLLSEAKTVADLVVSALSGARELDPELMGVMVDMARDPSHPLDERVGAFRWLARFGSDEAIYVLQHILQGNEAGEVRAVVARMLAACRHPETAQILTSLLKDEELTVVVAAIDALASHPTEDTTWTLQSLVADDRFEESIRGAAANSLGAHDGAGEILRSTFTPLENQLVSRATEGLAMRPFPENELLFRELMDDPAVPLELKEEAIDALSEGSLEAADFLLEVAVMSENPELRSAAIGALTMFDDPGYAIQDLHILLESELSPGVRADLYDALALHPESTAADPAALASRAMAERSPQARLAGYRMVANLVRRGNDPAIEATFDSEMVDWLRIAAEHGADRYTRHLSVHALKLAGTDAAREALLDLVYSPDPSVSDLAEKALYRASQLE
jgi:HEAT repeat protein